MIIAVINGKTPSQALKQIQEAGDLADLLEFRVDQFQDQSIETLQSMKKASKKPVLITLRSQNQGGEFVGDPYDRLLLLDQLSPEYIDLEWGTALPPIQSKKILSYHRFTKGMKDLAALYQKMKTVPADYYKIALTPENSSEALEMLQFAKDKPDLIAVAMGESASFSRILNHRFTYACVAESYHGQVSLRDLHEIYNYSRLHPQTKWFGLIGDPVEQSVGHLFHNERMRPYDASYVKIPVKSEELAQFISLAKQFPFHGLSVTMPLKEAVLPFLDVRSNDVQAIGACNTLLFRNGKIIGENTDGKGALNALEKQGSVAGQRILILGAGGSAKAIAYEAEKRGAKTQLLSRTARQNAAPLSEFSQCDYDVLINCTPSDLPVDPQRLLEGKTVMDIRVNPQDSSLLSEALKKRCRLVGWKEMFNEQAKLQLELFLSSQ